MSSIGLSGWFVPAHVQGNIAMMPLLLLIILSPIFMLLLLWPVSLHVRQFSHFVSLGIYVSYSSTIAFCVSCLLVSVIARMFELPSAVALMYAVALGMIAIWMNSARIVKFTANTTWAFASCYSLLSGILSMFGIWLMLHALS